jgi:hypothetical protein
MNSHIILFRIHLCKFKFFIDTCNLPIEYLLNTLDLIITSISLTVASPEYRFPLMSCLIPFEFVHDEQRFITIN